MLNQKLDEYLKEDYYPFHMPGAKRSNLLSKDLPYKRDLTEIPGFDNLNDPKDIFVDMEKNLSDIYKVKDAVISTNGSTCGILSTIRSLTYKNKNILVERSCHKSIYNAIELNNLSADYIKVILDDNGAIIDIDFDDLEKKLSENDYGALVITSPSYEGFYLDLEKIYNLTKKNDTPLVVDMAHGSHSILQDKYKTYFDIAITSFHKNLSALTPSSAVLINDEKYSEQIRRNMAIFQSSSPSYVILQSIDEMLDNFNKFYEMYTNLDENLDSIYKLKLNNLKIIDSSNKDRSKILISTINTNINGNKLENLLRTYKIEIEMSYPTYALLISTIFDTKEGFDRLKNALVDIDKSLKKLDNKFNFYYKIPKNFMKISETINKDKIYIDINQAKNKICGQFVYAYPPGIPLLTPGELIDEEIISNINHLTNNNIKLNIGKSLAVINWQKVILLLR